MTQQQQPDTGREALEALHELWAEAHPGDWTRESGMDWTVYLSQIDAARERLAVLLDTLAPALAREVLALREAYAKFKALLHEIGDPAFTGVHDARRELFALLDADTEGGDDAT